MCSSTLLFLRQNHWKTCSFIRVTTSLPFYSRCLRTSYTQEQVTSYLVVSWNRGTPSSHPFIDRIFHEINQPAIGVSPWLRKPPLLPPWLRKPSVRSPASSSFPSGRSGSVDPSDLHPVARTHLRRSDFYGDVPCFFLVGISWDFMII